MKFARNLPEIHPESDARNLFCEGLKQPYHVFLSEIDSVSFDNLPVSFPTDSDMTNHSDQCESTVYHPLINRKREPMFAYSEKKHTFAALIRLENLDPLYQ